MKKLLYMLLILMAASIFCISVAAENDLFFEEYELITEETYLAPEKAGYALEDIIDIEAFTDHLRTQFQNCVTTIDISSYNIPKTSENSNAIRDLIYNGIPECFHMENTFSLAYNSSIWTKVLIEYTCTPEEYSVKLAEFEQSVNVMLEGIAGNSSLSDVQKALLIHDRLAVWCEYDYENYKNNTIPAVSYTSYGAMVKKIAVCQGYADAYMYLLDKVGIESYICASKSLNHAWNIVFVDGEYYHVDVTWDDPVVDVSGRVSHENFMISSAEFNRTHEVVVSDYDTTPEDTRYDMHFWNNSLSAFQLLAGKIYYVDNLSSVIKTYDGDSIIDVSHIWLASATSMWDGNYTRLCTDGSLLYYSLSDTVYSYDPNTGAVKKVFEPEHSFGEYFFIFGMYFDGEDLVCELNSSPKFESDTKEAYTVSYTLYYPAPAILYGDATGDGIVDNKDLVRIKKYLAAYDYDTETSSVEISDIADATGDGVVDSKDLVRIKKYLAAFDYDTGKSTVKLGPA